MNLILFFFCLAKGVACISTVYLVALIISTILVAIGGIANPIRFLIELFIDVGAFLIFRHLGYPIKPILWYYLIVSGVVLNFVGFPLNLIGIICFYVFLL